jgi:membrane protein implicated in regulation of membrane protease activity
MFRPPVVPLQSPIGPDTLPILLIAAGLAVATAEAFIPGAQFIVVGLALLGAGIVGLAGATFGLPILASPFVLGLFVLLFGGLAFYGYRNLGLYQGTGEQTLDSDSLRGTTGRVTERVTPTSGEIKLDGGGFNPHYSARSVDGEIKAGTEVMVVDPGGGNVLTVESLSGGYDEIDRELARDRSRRGRTDGDGSGGGADGESADRTDADRELDADVERESGSD